ncbi:MAG: UDP-N-acetylmuramoyl-tripeptide--D-alanyl-D-alanine ligase [Vampirovibrionales bacterium]
MLNVTSHTTPTHWNPWTHSPIFTLKECLQWTSATTHTYQTGQCQRYPKGILVTTDTRGLSEQVKLAQDAGFSVAFMPIVGETFDGHTFIPEALKAGVQYVWVETSYWTHHAERLSNSAHQTPRFTAFWQVQNTLEAYQGLARGYRLKLAKLNPAQRVIALTGSSGKTTVKTLLAEVLSAYGATHASMKNHNNDIGVVQTLFQAQSHHAYVVIEMGMRGLGEIRRLAQCALPDIVLTLNVGPAHIGRLGSLEAIAEAKCEIVEGLFPWGSDDPRYTEASTQKTARGVWLTNGEDTLIQQRMLALQETLSPYSWLTLKTFGTPERLTEIGSGTCYRYYSSQKTRIDQIPLPHLGRHHALNVSAVLEVIETLELPFTPALDVLEKRSKQTSHAKNDHTLNTGRWEVLPAQPLTYPQSSGMLHTVFDAYNANPASMHASLTSFFAWLGQQPYTQPPEAEAQTDVLLVLGAMEELGAYSRQYHIQLGKQLASWMGERPIGWHRLFLIGEQARAVMETLDELGTCPPTALCDAFDTIEEAQGAFNAWLQDPRRPTKTVFLKGSRKYHLETLLQASS